MATLLLRVSASTKAANIGILFGAESVGFYQYGDGFRQGALFYNPDAKVYIDYTVGFSDTANAQSIAQNMINNMGCDVIWTCCGTAGLGGLEACRLNNAFGIGVDSNQDEVEPGNILTSAIRDNTSLLEFYIGKYLEGNIEQTEPDTFNLSNGGVDITDMSVIEQYVTDKDKLEELKGILDQCRKWIADGTITVVRRSYGEHRVRRPALGRLAPDRRQQRNLCRAEQEITDCVCPVEGSSSGACTINRMLW